MKKIKIITIIFLVCCYCLFGISCKKQDDNHDLEEYKVTFNLMGGIYQGSGSNITLTITKGNTIESFIPEKVGYAFQGWTSHLVQSMVADFVLDTPITSNTVLYAVWKKPQLKLNTNGGVVPIYSNIDELINDFLRDFNSWNGSTSVTAYSFFDRSYNKITSFLSVYQNKWMPLFDYIATVAHPKNKEAFENVFEKGEETNAYSSNIRIEFSGFLRKAKLENYYGYLYSADYTDEKLQLGALAYMPNHCPTFYVSNTDYYLPSAYRIGYNFMGWYDNSEFNGEPVEKINAGETKDFEFFARWELAQ